MALNEQDLKHIKEMIEESVGELQASIDGMADEVISALDPMADMEASMGSLTESAVENAVSKVFSEFEFILPDGTRVLPRKRMSLTSPDKTKVLICYGGLRAENTERFNSSNIPAGWGLSVQTGIDSWEIIFVYKTKDEAVSALEKVKNAIDNGVESLCL